MQVTFYGVRGSIPSPGEHTVRYGGNTSCLLLESFDGSRYVLDAGTGIRKLGRMLVQQAVKDVFVLLSHTHWDHIQGFPFFAPAFQPGCSIYIVGDCGTQQDRTMDILNQMTSRLFPVRARDLAASVKIITYKEFLEKQFFASGLSASRMELNHPGSGWAWRFEEEGRSFAYVTDNELLLPGDDGADLPYPLQHAYEDWVRFLSGVDLLVHDTQYLSEEMAQYYGWGHSVVDNVLQLAADAQVGALMLFHHDPERSDDALDRMLAHSRAQLEPKGIACYCAMEGHTAFLGRRFQVPTQNRQRLMPNHGGTSLALPAR